MKLRLGRVTKKLGFGRSIGRGGGKLAKGLRGGRRVRRSR